MKVLFCGWMTVLLVGVALVVSPGCTSAGSGGGSGDADGADLATDSTGGEATGQVDTGDPPDGDVAASSDGDQDAATCEPQCAELQCGDDGCGGSCGECGEGEVCEDGLCADCTCDGKECGDDGCGNDCGTCPGVAPYCYDNICSVECIPSCAEGGCGDDGCGGSCGTCPGAQDACVDGACVCVPICAESGACGDDGCGDSCGTCAEGKACDEGVCAACTCDGKECGDDGCGVDCGTCPGVAPFCYDHACSVDCIASCDGKSCGDDGCGGSCGGCPDGETCSEGACACVPTCAGDNACGDDGCGDSCGSCSGTDTCADGVCVGCSCEGKECGDDGCGGDCGPCPGAAPYCYENACSLQCVPACTGMECGDDGCGGACGACSADEWCAGGACVDTCPPMCLGQECGDDGCGGSCGSCGANGWCDSGSCEACSCAGLACGTDACGNSCGTCDDGQACVAGACQEDLLPDCADQACTGNTMEAVACALDICYGGDVLGEMNFWSPTSADISAAWIALNHYGTANNDLSPHYGESYVAIATGFVESATHQDQLAGNISGADPYAPDAAFINDALSFSLSLTAPEGVTGFSIDYIFMSQEYEEWIGSQFNDKFYIVLTAPTTTDGAATIINYTACSDPAAYFDFQQGGDKWCYVAINAAASEPCDAPNTNIGGTGFECTAGGSSTGWLGTTWSIAAGETFELVFHIHDAADQSYDSLVLLDHFRWETGPIDTGTGSTECGNELCEFGESTSCPEDCGGEPPPDPCGDGVCAADESVETCPVDCEEEPGEPPSCGGGLPGFCNGVCDPLQDPLICPDDCCGDGACNTPETPECCPADCAE